MLSDLLCNLDEIYEALLTHKPLIGIIISYINSRGQDDRQRDQHLRSYLAQPRTRTLIVSEKQIYIYAVAQPTAFLLHMCFARK